MSVNGSKAVHRHADDRKVMRTPHTGATAQLCEVFTIADSLTCQCSSTSSFSPVRGDNLPNRPTFFVPGELKVFRLC